MATIRSRPRRDGSTAHRVSWRDGGTRHGAQHSETFSDPRQAEQFRRAVELAGHHWPTGWVPGAGFVPTPEPTVPAVPVDLLLAFGQQYVRDLTDVGPDTRHRYLRQLAVLDRELTAIVGGPAVMQTIREEHVRRWVNWRLDQPRGNSPKTISNYHGLLFAVFGHAIKQGLRTDNPCAGHKLPDRLYADGEAAENVFLSEAQFALIADCMLPQQLAEAGDNGTAGGGAYLSPKAAGVHAGTLTDRRLIEVAVGTGLRWGEITALQVRDLDLDGTVGALSVKRAWKRNPPPGSEFHRPGAGDRYLGKPKTRKSRRTISISPVIVAILRAQIAGKAPGDLVFSAPMGGALRSATWYEDRWKKAVKLAQARGLTVTPRVHDLRHSHAAWLISAGVPLPVIQQRLGHESITTTVDLYGGLLPQAHAAADDAVDAALTGRAIGAPKVPVRRAAPRRGGKKTTVTVREPAPLP